MNFSTCPSTAIGPAERDPTPIHHHHHHRSRGTQNQDRNQSQNHPDSAYAGSDDSRDDGDGGGGLQVLQPTPITLEDHTVTPGENSPGLWARSACVVDYTIVSGTSRTGLKRGDFVSWNCSIQTLEVSPPHSRLADNSGLTGPQGAHFTVRKRYASFFQLHSQLKTTYPKAAQYLPSLPPKSLICRWPILAAAWGAG